MSRFRFLHCADLHLDSPLRGLEADPEAPAADIRLATRAALTNLVDFALAERVDFVLIAGDLYDGDWQDFRTGQFLISQISRLTRAGIPVIAIRGNHDAASVITRSLPWPEQARMLSADRAETVRFAALGVAIHGRSFPNREVLENFVPQYPRPDPGAFNIGLLHTAGTGRPGHAAYAPCTVEQLAAHGYDYWALGHIHTREILGQDPWIVFPGNIQGRHIRETGAKGATLVTVENGAVTAVTHHTLDVVRWEAISVDVTGASDENAALARVLPAFQTALAQAEGRLLAVRVTLTGTTAAHAALAASLGATREKVRAVAAGSGLWIEQAVIATRPPAAAESNDALGKLGQEIAAIAAEDLAALLKPWAEGLLDRASGLRAELPATHPAVLAATGTVTPELLERARDLLLARLAEA